MVRFYSGEGVPSMFCRNSGNGEMGKLGLSGFEDITFSMRLSCIGYKSPDGYLPCKNSAINTRQCPTCSALDVSRAYTVGDFSGYPSLYEGAKKEEYALYLAGFGEDIIKCGLTRKERFLPRMVEQGADFGCIIGSFTGPDEVYSKEAEIQSRFSFSNSVRLAQKLRRLHFDRGAASENFRSAVEMVKTSGALPDFTPEILDLSSHYPRMKAATETDSILGQILGAKGEILLFKSESGGEYAVNMRKKVGTHFKWEKGE